MNKWIVNTLLVAIAVVGTVWYMQKFNHSAPVPAPVPTPTPPKNQIECMQLDCMNASKKQMCDALMNTLSAAVGIMGEIDRGYAHASPEVIDRLNKIIELTNFHFWDNNRKCWELPD